MTQPTDDAPAARRRLGWGGTLLVLALWLAGGLVGAFAAYRVVGSESDDLVDPGATLALTALPAVVALALVALVVSRLRWWSPVLRDDRPARPWIWVVPLGLAAVAGLALDRDRVAAAGAGLVAAAALSALLVAASEELAFRGFLLVSLRDRYAELPAALLCTLLFGVAHMLAGGLSNLAQGVLTVLAGFLYYVTRRVTRGLAGAVILHGWYDFCVFSAALGPGSDDSSSLFGVAVGLLVLFAVALGGYRLWQPAR
ncbi:MAG: CPBP family intramembrane glutamic endopeptidase [Candidatus Nanopelagicales bacterium]